ncbi:hypothetical protein HHL11_25305 [Ramlibacter sp. G-1-2-2]|uniref:DUF4124 domain-containing protein n=1 Tax=Ramlibacter agri TaxID=2728837 RepID=A0A848HHD4_9BURK|nr:hypothetical protein [Ramlibacter agri]NML47088.1 hypothetical protein [Ramlibacter agri]
MKSLAYIASLALLAGSTFYIGVPRAAAQDCSDPRVNTAACQRERGAATQAKSQGKLATKGEDQYQANALKRCERQPEGAARESCHQRVMGTGNTTVSGSVKGGGELRTNEITVPAGEMKN